MGEVASYGRHCWLIDSRLAAVIVQRNGRHPHPKSVGRCRRSLVSLGLMQSTRRYAGQRIVREARWHTSHGCSVKAVKFAALGVRDPLRDAKQAPRTPTPRHSSAVALRPPDPPRSSSVPMDPRLAATVAELGSVLERRWDAAEAAEDAEMLASVPPTGRAPP